MLSTKKVILTDIHIIVMFRGRSPTLSLLCQENLKMSHQLPFLYPHSSKIVEEELFFEGTAYLNNVENGKLGIRCYLTKQEEACVIGSHAKRPKLPPRFLPTQILPPSPVTDDEIEKLHAELDQFHPADIDNVENQLENVQFPLDITLSSKLGEDMINELRESWKAHKDSPSRSPKHSWASIEALHIAVPQMKTQASDLRLRIENYALDVLNKTPIDSSHWHDDAHAMLRMVGIVPSATTADLARITFVPSLIKDFNPMLNQDACEMLVKSIITWLQLCVYEDKLARLISLCNAGETENIKSELETKPIWNRTDYPYWLVFEVENAIMIRQEQYKVAKHLIDHPGHILQLNMGLGKVRLLT